MRINKLAIAVKGGFGECLQGTEVPLAVTREIPHVRVSSGRAWDNCF